MPCHWFRPLVRPLLTNGINRSTRWGTYCGASGEILRSPHDEHLRKHSSSMPSSIKSESMGINQKNKRSRKVFAKEKLVKSGARYTQHIGKSRRLFATCPGCWNSPLKAVRYSPTAATRVGTVKIRRLLGNQQASSPRYLYAGAVSTIAKAWGFLHALLGVRNP